MYPIIQYVLDDLTTNSRLFERKGVSYQSDGTAQFIVKDDSTQQKVIATIKR